MLKKLILGVLAVFSVVSASIAEEKPAVDKTSVVWWDASKDVEVVEGLPGVVTDVQAVAVVEGNAPAEVVSQQNVAPIASQPSMVMTQQAAIRPSKPNVYKTSGLKVENMIITNNWGGSDSFSGGADMMHGNNAPAGFSGNNGNSKMPLLTQEMLEDDGAEVLSVSKTNRKPKLEEAEMGAEIGGDVVVEGAGDQGVVLNLKDGSVKDSTIVIDTTDGIKSWVVVSGKTLRQILQNWCDDAGWDLIWNTSREYPVAASAVFEGRFMDVASALVRNFGRATPIPYAKFYKGNKVLVITTLEDGDNNGY